MVVAMTPHTAVLLLAIAPLWLLVGFLIGRATNK